VRRPRCEPAGGVPGLVLVAPTQEHRVKPVTAVVTIAHGRHRHLRRQHASLAAGIQPDHYVVVAMDDRPLEGWTTATEPRPRVVRGPQDPLGLPLAAARNLGFRTAVALGADVLIGLDVDCLVGSATVGAYQAVVRERPDVLWSGPTTYLPQTARDCDPTDLDALDDPHPARPSPARGTHWIGGSPDHFWSLSFAVHATAWTAVGGFCERYAGYGGEDTDFAHAWQHSGRLLGWVGDARTYHQNHPTQNPPVQHLDDILRNGAIFAERWGRWPMGGWLSEFEARGLVDRTPDGGWARSRATEAVR
jgi:N-acetylglucosaminyl-diphospho-decaprenol L-rhamnosyltransferase